MLNQEYYKIQQFLVHQQCLQIFASDIDCLSEPRIYVPIIDEYERPQDFTYFVDEFQNIHKKRYKPLISYMSIPYEKETKNQKNPYLNSHSYSMIKQKSVQNKIKHFKILQEQEKKQQSQLISRKQPRFDLTQTIQLRDVQQSYSTSHFKLSQKQVQKQRPQVIKIESLKKNKVSQSRDSLPTPQFKANSQLSQKLEKKEVEKISNSLKNQSERDKNPKRSMKIRSQSADQDLVAHQIMIGTINDINQLKKKMESSFSVAQSDSEEDQFDMPARQAIVQPKQIHLSIQQYMTKS